MNKLIEIQYETPQYSTLLSLILRKIPALSRSQRLQGASWLANLRFFRLIILLLLCSKQICYSQKKVYITPISDSLVKSEMAYFTITGASSRDNKDRLGVKLKEIRLTRSGGSFITLEKWNWYAIHRLVRITLERFEVSKHKISFNNEKDSAISSIDDKPFWGTSYGLPQRKVKSINFIHVKMMVELPESAFDGIYEPTIYYCRTKADRKKHQNYFKAYLSEDNLRMYIYMLNGKGKDRYEVTWVVNGFDYYNRYINKVPE
jgi:hypothetical protein